MDDVKRVREKSYELGMKSLKKRIKFDQLLKFVDEIAKNHLIGWPKKSPLNMKTLPIEVISHIIRFLSLEDQLKLLDKNLVLLRNVGLPRNINAKDKVVTLRIILRAAKKYDLFNVLQFILYTETNAAKRVLFIAAQKGNLKLVEKVLSYASTSFLYPRKAIHWALFFAVQQGHISVFERLFPLVKLSMTRENILPLNLAFQLAAEKGQMDIVEQILQIIPEFYASSHRNYALRKASQNGHLHIVERLLKLPIVANSNFEESFCLAAENGHLAIVEKILQLSVNVISSRNSDIISSAVRNGHLHVVERLLKIDSVIANQDHRRALLWAARHGHLALVERIFQLFPDIDTTGFNGFSAIKEAATGGYFDIVERLVSSPKVAASITELNAAILIALKRDHMKIVKRLLEIPGVNVSEQVFHTINLQKAAARGQIEIVERLLQIPGVHPTAENNNAIRVAAANGHVAVVERLLDVPEVRFTILMDVVLCVLCSAFRNGHQDLIKRLFQLPGIENQLDWNSLLFEFADNLEIVERVLVQIPGAEINAASDPLVILKAAEGGNLAVVDRLLQIPGMDLTASDDDSPIQRAAGKGHIAVVERLLQIPSVDATANENAAIQCAAYEGHIEVVDRLLEIPGVTVIDRDHWLIHRAATHCYNDIIERFLEIPDLYE